MTLGIAMLFTSNLTNAFWTWPTSSDRCVNGVFPNCTDYPKSSRSLYFANAGTDYTDLNELNYFVGNGNSVNYDGYTYSQGKFYTKSTSSVRAGNLKTFNNGDYLAWRVRQDNGTTFYGYVSFIYNFINYTKDGDAPVFQWWYDLGKKYNSVSYYALPELPNIGGSGDYFYFNQPRHGSRIFYNYFYDKDLKTVQYIGNQVLRDKFIYVDTLASSDNIWLVDTNLNKAWSMTETDVDVLSDFLFGNFKFSDELLNNAGWTDYYDVVLNTGGNSFLPQTYGNFIPSSIPSNLGGVAGSKSWKGANIGLSYNKIYDFVGPDYGSSSGNLITGSAIDLDAVRNYEGCLKFNNDLLYLANNQNSCSKLIDYNCTCTGDNCSCLSLSEYVGLQNFIKNYNGTGSYTGVLYGLSCTQWLDGAMRMYNSLPDSYSSYILTSISWSSSPESINVQNMCGMYPDPSSEQSWACKYLGIGCSDFSFGVSYDYVKGFISPFWDDTVGELVRSFNSGFNYINVPACSSDYYGKSYGWANTVFIVLVALLIFELYQLFKS